jgi:predicted sulfurtransferase
MTPKGTTILAIVAAALTLGGLWLAHRPAVIKEATWEDVRAQAQSGGYRLISTEELARLHRQGTPNLLLVDTRQEWEYRTGHIQGAVAFPMEPTWWSRWRSQSRLQDLLGPDKDRPVVFY